MGIAAAGKISHDFAIGTLNTDENTYGSYEELAKDPDVEVVYVGTLNPYHMEVAIMMIKNNKHVLVEKTLCINEKQARKLINYAKQKQLFLMEAIWSRFFPSYKYLQKQINNGTLGEIEMVDVSFGFSGLDSVDKLYKKELGDGTVLDLGVYVIQFCQWIFKQSPKSITASGSLNQEGVDMEMSGIINYGDNKVGTVQTSASKTLNNAAIIKGSKGQMTVPSSTE